MKLPFVAFCSFLVMQAESELHTVKVVSNKNLIEQKLEEFNKTGKVSFSLELNSSTIFDIPLQLNDSHLEKWNKNLSTDEQKRCFGFLQAHALKLQKFIVAKFKACKNDKQREKCIKVVESFLISPKITRNFIDVFSNALQLEDVPKVSDKNTVKDKKITLKTIIL